MKSVKQITKRAFSPITGKTLETSQRKKKSNSNYPNNPYRPSKQFDSYANKDKKRNANFVKNILTSNQPINKYRIVTEPVDDRFINIVSSTFLPSRSRPKIDHEQSGAKIRQASTEKRNTEHICVNCQRLQEEISAIKNDINKIIESKNLWKNGEATLDDLKYQIGLAVPKGKGKIASLPSKTSENALTQIKKHFVDLMRDIESLSQIDYPKMLSHNIFKYEPRMQNSKGKQQDEIKSLLSQLRSHYDGKVTAWDLQDNSEESDHIKAIIRNLKSRLSHYLRENLELKTSKAILQKAQEISLQSEDYLRHLVESVLAAYAKKL